MNLPKRKNLRLPNYDYSENGAYYVTICTQNNLHLFGHVVGETIFYNLAGEMVLRWLNAIEQKYDGTHINCAMLMPNHLHFIIIFEKAQHPLGEILKWFKSQTTNEYIRNVKRGLLPKFEKRIWQRNYYEHIIRTESELQSIQEYIQFNVQKWNMLRE